MAVPTFTPLPPVPARTGLTPDAYAAAVDTFLAAWPQLQTDGDALLLYAESQANAALAAAVAGNLSAIDMLAGAGAFFKINAAGTALEYVTSIPGTTIPAATTTARGTVEKATTTESQGGTAANVFPDVVGVKAAIDAQTTTTYKTAWVAGLPPINATTAYTHTLGVAPDNVLLQLECTTAEFGIVVGQVTTITSGQGDANSGVTIFSDASNTAIRRGNYPIMIHDGTTYALLTETSWKHRLIVQAIK